MIKSGTGHHLRSSKWVSSIALAGAAAMFLSLSTPSAGATRLNLAPLVPSVIPPRPTSPLGLLAHGPFLYVSDNLDNTIRKIDTRTHLETIVAGVPGPAGYSGDGGPAVRARLCSPNFMALDGAGNLFFADRGNNRIRRVTASTGIIKTVAGRSSPCGFSTGGFSGDGGPATAADLDSPSGVAVDSHHNLFITDTYNHRIRMVSATGVITTIAGNGPTGSCCVGSFGGDGGAATAAQLFQPSAISFDHHANLVFSDTYNNRIRSISPTGTITTIVGSTDLTSGFCPPFTRGPALTVVLCGPIGFSFDGAGRMYFIDYYNNRTRKLDTFGNVTTFAGSGPTWPNPGGYSGDGGPAKAAVFNYAYDTAVGAAGVFIADTNNGAIRVVDGSGKISTFLRVDVP